MSPNYEQELAFAVALVKDLGPLMVDNLQVGHTADLKADGSYVTTIDQQINSRVIAAVHYRYPNDGIRGEEESDMHDDDEHTWIVDPLDGTNPFRWGIPTSMILVSRVKNGEVQIGVAYNPYINQLYTAARGLGAYVNGRKVSVNPDFARLSLTPIGTTGPDPSNLIDLKGARFDLARNGARDTILGSTGYETMMVGSGQFGGQVFGGDTLHDVVVGDLFVTEAGGKVTDLKGNPIDYSKGSMHGAITSNGTLHDILLDHVAMHIK